MTAYSTLKDLPGVVRQPGSASTLAFAPPALFAAWSAALVAGYLLLDAVSFVFWSDPIPVKPWNPQVGLAVALLYAGGVRYALPTFVAAWLSEALMRHPAEPWMQFGAALALTIAMTVTAVAMRWRAGSGLASVASVRDFLLIAVVGSGVSALLYIANYMLLSQAGFDEVYTSVLHKWLGDFAGMIVVTPLVVLMLSPGPRLLPVRQPGWLDGAVFLIALFAVVALLFGVEPQTGERLLYLLFVPLIVIAMRRGLAGAAIGVASVQVAIVAALWLAGASVEGAAAYEMLVVVLGVTTLVLGAVAGERRRAQIELARRSAELRAQQQALADAMRVSAASETAATLAHEMSQPLSAIGTYARAMLEMLRRGNTPTRELANITERIVAESARTRETVQRIRDFFRAGGVQRESIALRTLVDDVIDGLRDRLRTGGIAISTDVPQDLPRLFADRVQLGIVLHNLIGNAADAIASSPPPRWIRVLAREREGSVEVDVVDSGPGIDDSVREVLFEPLATTKPSGMGLGLPISRTLILAHGGRLELVALHPTTFRFILPIHGNVPE